jgi:hypothetical protein
MVFIPTDLFTFKTDSFIRRNAALYPVIFIFEKGLVALNLMVTIPPDAGFGNAKGSLIIRLSGWFGTAVFVAAGVLVRVQDGLFVTDIVGVAVTDGVRVDVRVGVLELTSVGDTEAVALALTVGLAVRVFTGVAVDEGVLEAVPVAVMLSVLTGVAVDEDVRVKEGKGLIVRVAVSQDAAVLITDLVPACQP